MPRIQPGYEANVWIADWVLTVLALTLAVSAANGQPMSFVEDFGSSFNLDTFNVGGDESGHPTTVAGTYDISDAHGSPGVKLGRFTPGTLSSYTHEVELTLNPFALTEFGGTQTDFKLKSFGSDGFIEIVLNSFGDLRVFHGNPTTGNSGNIHPPPMEPNINIGYVDGDLLKLTSSYDQVADTIDVTYSLNDGATVEFYSGTGNGGSLGDVITSFVEIEAFKWGDDLLDKATISIDNWSVTAGNVVSGLACDSDGDGDCEQDDINAMYAAFGNAGQFDYDGSGTIGDGDIRGWLADASSSANLFNTGNKTFAIGDIDLDGNVNSVDLGLLLNNFNSTSALNWSDGNLNGDGEVNSVDLGQLLNNFNFTSASIQAVPEPIGASLFILSMAGLITASRFRVEFKRRRSPEFVRADRP